MTTVRPAVSFPIRAFQVFITALLLAIAMSTVHGWVNLGDSVDQVVRFFGAAAPGAEESPAGLEPYRGGADVVLVSGAMLAACFLAFMLVWKAPERRDARALALFLVLLILPVNLLRSTLHTLGWQVDDGQLLGLAWVPQWLALAAFLRFSVLFPSELHEGDIADVFRQLRSRRRSLLRSPRAGRGTAAGSDDFAKSVSEGPSAADRLNDRTPWRARIQYALLKPAFVWGGAAALSVLTIILALRGTGMSPTWFLIFGVIVLAAIVRGTQHLRVSYRVGDTGERKQILWIVHGFYASMWAALLLYIVVPLFERYGPRAMVGGVGWPAIGQILLPLILTIIVVSLYMGVFHSGALDPHRVIRKTTIYGFVLLAEIFLFGAIEGIAANMLITRVFGEGVSNAGTYVAVGIVALAFRPLKRWADAHAVKWIPGFKRL